MVALSNELRYRQILNQHSTNSTVYGNYLKASRPVGTPLSHAMCQTRDTRTSLLLLMRGGGNINNLFMNTNLFMKSSMKNAILKLINESIFDWHIDTMDPNLWLFLHVFLPAVHRGGPYASLHAVQHIILEYLHYGKPRRRLKASLPSTVPQPPLPNTVPCLDD